MQGFIIHRKKTKGSNDINSNTSWDRNVQEEKFILFVITPEVFDLSLSFLWSVERVFPNHLDSH